MGGIDTDTSYGWEYYGGAWYGVLTVSRGSPAHHSGIAWEAVAPRDDGGVMEALVIAAGDGSAALADALADAPTLNAEGPFPGVSGSQWWSTLPAPVKAAVVAAGAAWADSGEMP